MNKIHITLRGGPKDGESFEISGKAGTLAPDAFEWPSEAPPEDILGYERYCGHDQDIMFSGEKEAFYFYEGFRELKK